MQRFLVLMIGIPLGLFLLYVLWSMFMAWRDSLKERDFAAVAVLRNRDKLLADVTRYIFHLESVSEKPSYALHEKFQALKDAKTTPQIEFATAELADEFTKEQQGLDPVIKRFLGR